MIKFLVIEIDLVINRLWGFNIVLVTMKLMVIERCEFWCLTPYHRDPDLGYGLIDPILT